MSLDLPGGAISHRPLRFFWLLDVSGSMAGSKIGQLNHAIRETLPEMQSSAEENPHAAVEIRAMTFSTGYRWITPKPVALADFGWTDVSVSGITDMGAAMKAMAAEIAVDNMPDRGLPPVIVLVTDGQPTDDFDSGLRALLAEPWGKRAIRIAIGIGDDPDDDVLRRFIAHPEIEPLTAKNPADLVQFIKYASTTVLKSASAPASQSAGTKFLGTPPPPPPPPPPTLAAPDVVW
ncbi:VWA domain-containing protein [Umezawaea sp. Da 62-37]|uniref:vWA domain-containing protein n=1 Tax=Umezawaea sp. Da 62-37 TaxID=3075927 RepID=UPI0028F6F2C4|nr:VWA domain-containing protein [Umezawaea sp. Da 62-37]WNV87631.1 VWA domain-containing protein [Umezawaea sp. Da 62-37]